MVMIKLIILCQKTKGDAKGQHFKSRREAPSLSASLFHPITSDLGICWNVPTSSYESTLYSLLFYPICLISFH